MLNITSKTIAKAIGGMKDPAAFAIRHGFNRYDPGSFASGTARNWTHDDLLRLCLGLKLVDIGLAPTVFGEIPQIPVMSDRITCAAISIYEIMLSDGMWAPDDYRVRFSSERGLSRLPTDASYRLVVDLRRVREDVTKIMEAAR